MPDRPAPRGEAEGGALSPSFPRCAKCGGARSAQIVGLMDELSNAEAELLRKVEAARLRKETARADLMNKDVRFKVAGAIRDWIHGQPFSQCGPGVDTCPDWSLAFEIRDVALAALDIALNGKESA